MPGIINGGRKKRAAAALLYLRRNQSNRRHWVHPILQKRSQLGERATLVEELRLDPERFYQYFRMSPETFDYIHDQIKDDIKMKTTNWREPVPTQDKLAAVLRYLLKSN